jgi:hypothetical protein
VAAEEVKRSMQSSVQVLSVGLTFSFVICSL